MMERLLLNDRRRHEDRPAEATFTGATGLAPETERRIWRVANRILDSNRCTWPGVFLCGIPVYIAWKD